MHSHDRTLLARLGFQDPDRKNRRHDLACQYLALPENQDRIFDLIWPRVEFWRNDGRPAGVPRVVRDDYESRAQRFEFPLQKSEGQYATTIGFLDLVLVWVPIDNSDEQVAVIEVKIAPCSASEIVRQINLYREYLKCRSWFAATAFGLPGSDVHMLKQSGVTHLRLGPGFAKFVEAQKNMPEGASEPSVEF